jgi:hypothetical protein
MTKAKSAATEMMEAALRMYGPRTEVLDQRLYRSTTGEDITRNNIDEFLDHGKIEIAMAFRGEPNGKWWKIRRNGKTQRWVKDKSRIRIPYKYGLKGYGAIDERDFV